MATVHIHLCLVCLLGCYLLLSAGFAFGGGAPESELKCMFLGYPDLEYDGVDRTEPLTDKTFNKTVFADGAMSIVFFNDVEADDDEWDQFECFLQLTAQIMEKRDYKVFVVNTTKEVKLRKQEDVDKDEDTVHVYKDGYQIEYNGVRDPETFVSWLMQIPDDPVTIINDKDDKEAFDDMADEITRIIGYFEPGSAGLTEFEEAAEDFMGEAEFFAVVDSRWARKMHLDGIGEVHMYRPFEREPLEAPDTTDTEEEFEEWVKNNMEPVMQKLALENYYNVWRDPEPDEKMIVAFCDEETTEGKTLFKVLKKLARANAEHAGHLEIILIDPDEFPLMVDAWEKMFGIEIEEGPMIGLIDISEHEGLWFDMSQLNLDDPKQHQESNLEVLQRWVDQIMSGSIALDGGKTTREKRAASNRETVETENEDVKRDSPIGQVSKRKTKRMKFKKNRRRRPEEDEDAETQETTAASYLLDPMDGLGSPEYVSRVSGETWREICDFEQLILIERIQLLETEIERLTTLVDQSDSIEEDIENLNRNSRLKARPLKKKGESQDRDLISENETSKTKNNDSSAAPAATIYKPWAHGLGDDDNQVVVGKNRSGASAPPHFRGLEGRGAIGLNAEETGYHHHGQSPFTHHHHHLHKPKILRRCRRKHLEKLCPATSKSVSADRCLNTNTTIFSSSSLNAAGLAESFRVDEEDDEPEPPPPPAASKGKPKKKSEL